jgi:hypothetical protein
MIPLRLMAIGLAVLFPNCASDSPTGTGRSPRPADAGPDAAWHTWNEVRMIPDGDRRGTLIGPLFSPDDGGDLSLLVLELNIRHPAPGDLELHLAYDADDDGKPEVSIPIELSRYRTSPHGAERHAFPRWLEGTYFFRDGSGEQEPMFAAFHSLPAGHHFYLMVADTLAQETGAVLGWALQISREGLAGPR